MSHGRRAGFSHRPSLLGACLGWAAVSVSLACAERTSGPTVIDFWAMGSEAERIESIINDFEQKNPDVRVEVLQIPWTAAHQKLLTAYAGDATPDVAQLGNTWIAEFVAIDALAPLEDRVATSTIIDAGDYFRGVWDTNVVQSSLYGVPWYVDTRLLFYRRDLLAKAGFTRAPSSWSEWVQMMAAVTGGGGVDRYGVLLPLNEFEPLLALALQGSEPLVRELDSRGNFDSDGFREALGFYRDIFRQGLAPRITNNQISNVYHEFGRGRFVFFVGGPWYVGELRRRLPADVQDAWSTAPMPGPDGPGFSTAGGSSLVVFRASRAKAAAWRLVEFLSQASVQNRFHALTGNLPPRRSVWADDDLAQDVRAQAFRAQLERVRPTPKVPEWERIAAEMRDVAERVVRENWTIAAAVRELDDRADLILEKRRWMKRREVLR